MKLIIQIPCYNEEETLAATIADLPRHIDGVDTIEYLVIDDGSSDRTVQIAIVCGVHHIVSLKTNKGLARAFAVGMDACVKLGADIIVNTDGDNQYNGADIETLVKPILENHAEIVIGERPIGSTKHFSATKKKMQRLGSLVVRIASGTGIPDAPSGFRAYTREAALQINVINEFTYTLETIIQAGHNRTAITSVPIRTNKETRKSRLFKGMWTYMRRSAIVIARSMIMYRPLKFFSILGILNATAGAALVIRWLVISSFGRMGGNIQSLVMAAMLIMIGVQFVIAGLQADIIAANRKIMEDVQYRVRKMECAGKNTDED